MPLIMHKFFAGLANPTGRNKDDSSWDRQSVPVCWALAGTCSALIGLPVARHSHKVITSHNLSLNLLPPLHISLCNLSNTPHLTPSTPSRAPCPIARCTRPRRLLRCEHFYLRITAGFTTTHENVGTKWLTKTLLSLLGSNIVV